MSKIQPTILFQTGAYLGEDDIIRYDDKHSRQTF